MVTYSVHVPPDVSANRLESAEQLVFVKDGYSWLAALAPPLWLLWKRMWLELAIFAVGTGLTVWALSALGAPNLGSAMLLIVQIVFGFEAGALYSAALERRGWRLVGTVGGRHSEDAERRFLEVWLPTRTEIPAAAAVDPFAQSRTAGTWTQTALGQAKDALARGRRVFTRASA